MNTGEQATAQEIFSLFFEPRSIAIVGSLKEGGFGGYVVVKSLLEAGYEGEIYPVNPGYPSVLGRKAYGSLQEIPGPVDLALVMINARNVSGMIEQAGRKGIRAVVVVADGFAERDLAGARLQQELVQCSRKWGIRIVGPNTAGVASSHNGLNPCPYDAGYYRLKPGPIAICAQSGMVNPQAVAYPDLGVGISKICDFGNKCDLDECDLLSYLEKDPETRVISMYVESIADGRRFLEAAKRTVAKKPVLVLKLGRTAEGARASASHTGSMAVDDRVFEAICGQAGLLRLKNFRELFDMPKMFATQPPCQGNRFAMVSYTGGIGVAALDEASHYGMVPARLSPENAHAFNDIFQGLGNMPVDLGPMIPTVKDFSTIYTKILRAVITDPHVDALFNVVWADARGNNTKAYLEAYQVLKEVARKPVVTWVYGPSFQNIANLTRPIEHLGFPVFAEPETCIKALGLAFQYERRRRERKLQADDQ